MKCIFLIGFMGSGKSYVGRQLARRLGLPFVDLDEVIEEKAKMTIGEIFEKEGEAAFRRREAQALRSCEARGEAVVACGGGAPCFHDNIQWMNQHGITIYLRADAPLLVRRLEPELAHRPLLKGKSRRELENFIKMKVAERETFYLQAGVVYHQKTGDEPVVDDLAERLQEIIGH